MSKTKAGGSTRNGRDSESKRLGTKVFDGDKIYLLVQLSLGKEVQKYTLVKMSQKVGTMTLYLQRLME